VGLNKTVNGVDITNCIGECHVERLFLASFRSSRARTLINQRGNDHFCCTLGCFKYFDAHGRPEQFISVTLA
jgi:hypothetical protein